MIAEEGLYYFSNHMLIFSSGNITSKTMSEDHVESSDYPHAAGCISSTNSPCSFTSISKYPSEFYHLGAIQQIQSSNNVNDFGNDLWLTVRARSIQDSFAEF